MRVIKALCVALCVAGSAEAQERHEREREREELDTDRPDQTESTGTITPGMVQFEGGWVASHEALSVPEVLVRFGVRDRLELRVGWSGWHRTETVSGAGDLEAGFKYTLSRRGHTAVAFVTDVALPSGHDAFSEGRFSPVARLAVSHEFERWSTGYNVGVAISEAVEGLYTWTVGLPLNSHAGVFGEVFGAVGLNDHAHSSTSVDAGVTWEIRPNVQLDVLGGVGVSQHAEDWFVGAGISVRVPR